VEPAGSHAGRLVGTSLASGFEAAPVRRVLGDASVALVASKPFTRVVESVRPEAAGDRVNTLATLLPRYGLTAQALAVPDARVPHRLSLELLERSAWLIGTEAIALRAVEAWQLGDQGIGDYLNATCATVGDFLATIVGHVGLLNDGIRFSVESDGETARLFYDLYPGVVESRWVAEATLGKVVAELRRALGEERGGRLLLRVRFRHAAPAYEREYRTLFRAPVEFGDDRDALELPAGMLTEPLVTADPVLHGLLRRQATMMLQARPQRASLLDRVSVALKEELARGTADQLSVARRVGVSTATLRRRLELEHGVRYTDLLDELRRERAVSQLSDPEMTIDEIAYQAGFSQTSAFYRAFKRWYGCTPAQYRRSHTLMPPRSISRGAL
jgi:AraC-like DNA-binding protein